MRWCRSRWTKSRRGSPRLARAGTNDWRGCVSLCSNSSRSRTKRVRRNQLELWAAESDQRLARLGDEGGGIDELTHVRSTRRCLRDHRAAVRMTHEDLVASDDVQRGPDPCDVVIRAEQAKGRCRRLIAVLAKVGRDLAPAGRSGPCAVNENDRRRVRRIEALCLCTARDERQQSKGDRRTQHDRAARSW